MNRTVVRWLDRDIGRPIVLCLTLHRRFLELFKKTGTTFKKPSKILLLKLVEQGSTVLAYPAMRAASEYIGRDNLFFLVFKKNRHIVEIIGEIPQENIIVIDPENIVTLIISSCKAMRRLRGEKIDAVLDMEFFARISAIFSYISGARIRVGLHIFKGEGSYRGDLMTHRLMYNPYLHTRIFFLSLVEALKVDKPPSEGPLMLKTPEASDKLPVFKPSENEKNAVIAKIERLKGSSMGRPIVLLNPNVSDMIPIRRWPEENFIELGKLLVKDFSEATVIITGRKDEEERSKSISSKIEGSVSIAGDTSLRELFTLYCLADILVTNDSGPAHFAALTPVRSIIIFGPETPRLYATPRSSSQIIASDLICSPCVNVYNQRKSPCGIGSCMKAVAPEDMMKRIKSIL